jgi:ATP-dependent DNA helicase RecG
MKILGYVNRFSRGVYRVQKELMENGNGEATFDFSLITAFKVVENVSQRYFEAGFGAEEGRDTQENSRETAEKIIDALTSSPNISKPELAELLGVSLGSFKQHLFFFWYKQELRPVISALLKRIRRPDLLHKLFR